MVLVVCPNLAVDYTVRVDKLRLGHVHRSHTYQRQAGGKGVNTARALRALGQEPLICGFIGGESGRFIERGLAEEKLRRELVSIESENRTCVIVLSEDGEATVVNESGPTVTESDALMSLVATLIPESDAVAMMGACLRECPVTHTPRSRNVVVMPRCRAWSMPRAPRWSRLSESDPRMRSPIERKPKSCWADRSPTRSLRLERFDISSPRWWSSRWEMKVRFCRRPV